MSVDQENVNNELLLFVDKLIVSLVSIRKDIGLYVQLKKIIDCIMDENYNVYVLKKTDSFFVDLFYNKFENILHKHVNFFSELKEIDNRRRNIILCFDITQDNYIQELSEYINNKSKIVVISSNEKINKNEKIINLDIKKSNSDNIDFFTLAIGDFICSFIKEKEKGNKNEI